MAFLFSSLFGAFNSAHDLGESLQSFFGGFLAANENLSLDFTNTENAISATDEAFQNYENGTGSFSAVIADTNIAATDIIHTVGDVAEGGGGAYAAVGVLAVGVGILFLPEEAAGVGLAAVIEESGLINTGRIIATQGFTAAAAGSFLNDISKIDSYLTSIFAPTPNPVITAPSTETVAINHNIPVTGVSISDPSAVGAADNLTVVVSANDGTVTMIDASGDTVPGSGTSVITLHGSLEEINSELATLFYSAGSFAGNGGIGLDVEDQAGVEKTKSIAVTITGSTPTTPPTPPPTPNSSPIGVAWGDVHMVTFDDLTYDFQAVGEFVLAESTVGGDSYQVQARLQPYGTSTTISIMTQLAAEVGSDRVTFDDTRADIVWVDGTPSTLSATNPTITLIGGTLTELSSNQYQVKWNTGETLTVTNWGPYLQISTQLSPTDGPGSVKGLLGSDTGQANDFQLADGTVIKQPLTTAELYGEFANAWRVTQASSLLDYGTGQTTATFTNLNFPYQPGSLSDFTAAQLAAAAQLVAAAGITDPNVAAAAELDYLETGDTRFISGAVATSQSDPNTTPAVVTPTPTPTPTGFDGDTVTLNGYYGAIIPADLDLTGTATVTPDTTTFPSFNALSTGGAIVDGSLTVSGNTLTFLYPQSEGGEQFAGGPVNTYVLTDTNPDAPAIVGVTLTSTNIPGLTSSDLTFGAHNVDLNVSGLTLPSSAPGSAVITVDYASPTPTPTGFDGDQITLTAYYGNGLTSGDIIGTGSAMVVPGTTTFPSLAALENGSNGTRLFDGSLTLSGDTMTFLYAPSEEGNMFGSAPANTYDIQTAANDPAITAASLISTNITGLTASDLSFSAHEIDLKVAGLTLPTGVQGSIVLGFSFAGQSASASSLVVHPST